MILFAIGEIITDQTLINLHMVLSSMQERLYKHFCDGEHNDFLNDISITFIDKNDFTNPL